MSFSEAPHPVFQDVLSRFPFYLFPLKKEKGCHCNRGYWCRFADQINTEKLLLNSSIIFENVFVF